MLRRHNYVVPCLVGTLFASIFSSVESQAQVLSRVTERVKTPARVVERGQNYAKWESVIEITDPINGESIQRTNSYFQIEVGLRFQDARGRWQ